MKFTLIATFALVASVMAQTNNTVPNNGMGGTAATASISVNTPANKNAATQLNSGIMALAFTSAVTAYALI